MTAEFIMQIITDPDKIDFTKLESFVYNHSDANFFQSTIAYSFFELIDNYEPVIVVVVDNQKILGSLIGVKIKEGRGFKGYLSKRLIIYGGPLVIDNDVKITHLLLQHFKNIAPQISIYSQFRNFFDMSQFDQIFRKTAWEYEEHLNILIDLTKSEEVLWGEVNSKRRNEIRKAQKQGTTFDTLKNEFHLEKTYSILSEVYNRAKLPLPKFDFFQKAYEILTPNHFKVFIAFNDGQIIGTMFTLCYKDTIYDWYAGSYQEFYKKYPNDLIPWKVFLWGKDNGYKKFDFGGAGKPNIPYGVRDYKKKFGGELVNYGRYEQIHKPILFKFAKIGFKIYQKLK